MVTVDDKTQNRGYCELSFGYLTWTTTDDHHIVAKFEPKSNPNLNAARQPLGSVGTLLKNNLWNSYTTALEIDKGISNPEMVWPDPNTTPLSKRLQCLVTNLDRVKNRANGLIVTRAWLSYASNIKRRAMTNGGKDDTFLADAYEALAKHPVRPRLYEYELRELQADLKECFFFEAHRFHIEDPKKAYISIEPPKLIKPSDILEGRVGLIQYRGPCFLEGTIICIE